MRFKNKGYRTVHKSCKTCLFKEGIKCGYLGYDNQLCEPGECNYHSNRLYDEEEFKKEIRHNQNNWKKLHRKEYLQELKGKIQRDIRFKKFWDNLAYKEGE